MHAIQMKSDRHERRNRITFVDNFCCVHCPRFFSAPAWRPWQIPSPCRHEWPWQLWHVVAKRRQCAYHPKVTWVSPVEVGKLLDKQIKYPRIRCDLEIRMNDVHYTI